MDKANPACGCHHHKIVPIIIVLIGLDFLLAALGILSSGFLAISWPILLVIAGLVKMMGRSCKCCSV